MSHSKSNVYVVFLFRKVYLDENNNIKSTECECPRGAFKCSHAAAIFVYGIHNLGRTDTECQWKNLGRQPAREDRAALYDDLKKYAMVTWRHTSGLYSNSFLKLLKPRAWGVCQRGMQTVDMRTRTEKVRTWESAGLRKKRSKKEECIKQACIRSILGVICLLLLFLWVVLKNKNKNSLGTIEAKIVQKLKNNEARPKFTGSY